MGRQNRIDSDVAQKVRAVVSCAQMERRIAGGVVLVAKDGELVAEEAFGFENLRLAVPMKTSQCFRLASVTKPIVSLAVIRLVDCGELDLYEPVTRWLPYFRPSLATGNVPGITLHHLLTHSSGLSYGFQEVAGGQYETLGVSDGLDQSGISLEENLRRLSSAHLQFEPGTAWRYSLAIDVLGAVIEKVIGAELPVAIEELVSRPLGLQSLAFAVSTDTALAVPYVDGAGALDEMPDFAEVTPPDGNGAIRFSPNRAYLADEFPSGGAGMVGTAPDVLRLLEVLRKDGGGFISSQRARTMFHPHVGADLRGQGDGWGYGYMGAVLVDPSVMDTPQSVGTVEWGGVYGHNWFVDRTSALTVVSLTNTTWEGVGGSFPQEVRNAIYASIR
ncbi:beta-lactamase family protein [Paraburkholderia sp. Ac-20340]|uniref:serine hydrolase domain-containing protein n=1 Tax=Paraburkholderia sp. Ac-20340 TaxID=2703888 RepID=UPI00197CD0C9|nr:serine hydrolase domain-containing protein [Paraburkholderia sp. Ac-20340]MBN3854014.1 beta-lactamase family protein [Paraburkholderia sp. Ac-20340]